MYKITSTCLLLNTRNYFVSICHLFLFFTSILFLLILGSNKSYAQTVTVIACDVPTTFNCDPNNANSAIIMDTQPNKEFTFDNFSEYNGGITLNGSTILKLKVAASTSTLATGTCQWKLVMIVSNGGSPTPNSEWETLTNYGSTAGAKPTLDLLAVRVSNGCSTPQNSGSWQFFAPIDGSPIDIINPATLQAPGAAAACGTETNGVGTYLGADYNEYSFTIDYRMSPGFAYKPGRYELFIKFCLVEK